MIWKKNNLFITFYLLINLSFASTQVEKKDVTKAIVWNKWEFNFFSKINYLNPYSDVTISVIYKGSGNQTIKGYGFWDGENNFKIRCMFPTAGTWTWETICSDSTNKELHNRKGIIEVGEYSGNNILYERGYLKISVNKKYLTYHDGTPFFWFADTPWSALIAATQDEWENYIQKRKSQHFNVLQIHSRDGWINRKTDRLGNKPFIGSEDSLRWNPEYWKETDRKIQYANDQGMIVFFAAVRQPGPGVSDKDTNQVKFFARNLAGRMMGNFVVYSPIADDLWTSYADVSGAELKKATNIHLVTAHPRFFREPAEIFLKKDYIDFAGMQTGSGWRFDPYFKEKKVPHSASVAIQNVIEWPFDLYYMNPDKPILNLEGVYDSKARVTGDETRYESPFPSRISHSAAYLSVLNGTRGYSYGINGVWNWGTTRGWLGETWSFDEAMNQHCTNYLKYMYELFSSVEWWNLIPRPDLIMNQSENWLEKMALSVTSDGKQVVAYLQDNDFININMNVLSGTVKTRWFNPEKNSWIKEDVLVVNAGIHSFQKPIGWDDAVLVLETVSVASTSLPKK